MQGFFRIIEYKPIKSNNMSHFIATAISISKDFKTYNVKGGANNCRPLSNEWLTKDIPIEHLFDGISSGNVHLKSYNEKSAFINHMVWKYRNIFGGDFNDETDYYHMKRYQSECTKVVEFDKEFLKALITGLKNLSTKKEYVIRYNDVYYVNKITVTRTFYSPDIKNAKRLSKYHVLEYAGGRRDMKVERIDTKENVLMNVFSKI